MNRIPYPEVEASKRDITEEQWNVLATVQFPEATEYGILLAWDTAKSKSLDVFAGHIAIVTQSRYDREARETRWYETAWPTVKAQTFIAHRTGLFAGMEPIVFGEERTQNFKGRGNNPRDIEINYPTSATATVYRLVNGEKCAFTETVFFMEYAHFKDGVPVWNWHAKPRMMLSKCAKAAALRLAFTECNYSAEEMEGHAAQSETEALPISEGVPEGNAADTPTPHDGDSNNPLQSEKGSTNSYSVMTSDSLDWLARTLDTAIATGAYANAQTTALSALEPSMHSTAKKVLESAQAISGCPNSKKLFDFLSKVKNQSAFEAGRETLGKRKKEKQLPETEYNSAVCLIDFFEKIKKRAA